MRGDLQIPRENETVPETGESPPPSQREDDSNMEIEDLDCNSSEVSVEGHPKKGHLLLKKGRSAARIIRYNLPISQIKYCGVDRYGILTRKPG